MEAAVGEQPTGAVEQMQVPVEQQIAEQVPIVVAPGDAAGVVAAENALKRPAEDAAEDGPEAKRLHTQDEQQHHGINGAPYDAAAAGAVGAGDVQHEAAELAAQLEAQQAQAQAQAQAQELVQALDQAQQQAQEQPYGDAAPGAAAAAAAEQHQHQQADQDLPAVRHEYEHAEAAARAGGGGGGGRGLDLGSFKLPADAILKQDIPLPRRMASCVIGIKGQSVSKLRRESGAKIHVRPAVGREEMDQVVEIEGAIESVVTCVRMVGDLLASEDPAFKMHPKPQVTSRFLVLPEMIGPAIIGKGGTHAKHIKERTGVRIEVVPATAANQSRQEIVLHGPPERVREAYHLLLGNIRKYGPTNLPQGAVPNPLPFGRPGGRGEAPPPWRSGRDAYSPGARGGPYGGPPPPGSRGGPPPPPPPRGGAPPPYRYDGYAPPAAYPAADPYRAPAQVAAAPYTTPAAPAAAAATYQAADATAQAAAAAPAAAAGGQQMMYILQDGVLKPLVMYQQGTTTAAGAAPAASAYSTATAAPAVAQTAVLQTGYAAAPTASYGTAAPAQPTSTGATGMYQQAAATGATQYTYAVPSTDASGQQTWAVQQLGGQVAATSAPLATAPGTYTAAAGYGTQATTQYATAPTTQYYYQPQ